MEQVRLKKERREFAKCTLDFNETDRKKQASNDPAQHTYGRKQDVIS